MTSRTTTTRLRLRKGNRRRRDPAEAKAKVRAGARTAARFVGKLLLAFFLVGGVFASVFGLWRWATTSPVFAVRDVRVQGNERATLDALAPLTGLERGTNIFLVDTAAAEAGLERHPWVRRAVVRRDPPSGVEITVEEHRPALLADLGSLYLVSDEAEVFKRFVPGDPVDLPIVSGVEELEDAEDGRLAERLRTALDIVAAWRASAVSARAALSQVHLDAVRGATLTARPKAEDAPPMVVHLGRRDLEKRLARLDKLYDLLAERGELPREVFLDNGTRPQWVVARVRD